MLNAALVVDDESLVRSFVAHVLHVLNFEVLEAESEEEGWELFLRNEDHITYVFTDIHLIRGNGYQLYRKIRERAPLLKIVVASGLPGTEHEGILHDPQGDFLSKPFSVDALIQTARDAANSLPLKQSLTPCRSVA